MPQLQIQLRESLLRGIPHRLRRLGVGDQGLEALARLGQLAEARRDSRELEGEPAVRARERGRADEAVVRAAKVARLLQHARERAMRGGILGQQLHDRGVRAASGLQITALAVEVTEQSNDDEVVRVDRAPRASGGQCITELAGALQAADEREASLATGPVGGDARSQPLEIVGVDGVAGACGLAVHDGQGEPGTGRWCGGVEPTGRRRERDRRHQCAT